MQSLRSLINNQQLNNTTRLKAHHAYTKLDGLSRNLTLHNFMDEWNKHRSILVSTIKSQIARVRTTKAKRLDNSAVEEAETWLEKLKKMLWEDAKEEWSKIRVDGPTVLTKNPVCGPEMDVETKELLKHYLKEGIISK